MKISKNKLFKSSRCPQNKNSIIKSKKLSYILSTNSKIPSRQISNNLKFHNKKQFHPKIDTQKNSYNISKD